MNRPASTATVTETTTTKTAPKQLVLRLKETKKAAITWTEDTVDNENLNRKSSKSNNLFPSII